MLDTTTIARPYARAVFEQAREDNTMDAWSTLLKTLETIVQNSQMKALIGNPRVNAGQLLEIFRAACGAQLTPAATNFVRVLIDNDRLRYVPAISMLFEERRAEAEGRIDIHVATAFELSPAQEKMLAEAMTRRVGKQVTIASVVDSTLIGGMIIRAGDSVIDASLRGRLTSLGNELNG